MDLQGFLNIDKPEGMTSADVVRVLKRSINVKKIGYIGTLDPIATGVLPIGMGKATRVFPFLERLDKTYDAVMILGSATDTQDRTGKVTDEADPSGVTEEQIVEAMAQFTGEIEQIPPMFSAKKIDGKRLYELAREGKVVERKPIKTNVYSLDLISIDGPRVRFKAKVSTGAYIRTICDDIGKKLGVYAHLGELARLGNGPFSIDNSVKLSAIEEGGLPVAEENLISLADGPDHLCKAIVVAHAAERVKNGRGVGISEIIDFQDRDGVNLVRIVDKNGRLLAICEKTGTPLAGFPFTMLNPKRVLI